MPHRGRANILVVAFLAVAPATPAQELVLSVRDNVDAALGGIALLDGDAVRYDPVDMTASILLGESDFDSGSIDINAFHVRADGTFLAISGERPVSP